MGLASIPDSKNLDLTDSQAQGNVGFANMLNLRNLDLTVSQIQSNVNLTNMSNPKYLGLVVSQPKVRWVWQAYHTQKTWTLSSSKAIWLILDNSLE